MAEYVVGVGETYENLNSIKSLVSAGDIVSIKGNIDDSASGVMIFTNSLTGTIFRSHPDNTENPTVNLGSSSLQFENYIDVDGFQINDIKFDINMVSNNSIYFIYTTGNVSINRCEFFNSMVSTAVEVNRAVIQFAFSSNIIVKNCHFHDLKNRILGAGDGNSYTLDSCLIENVYCPTSHSVIWMTYTQDVVKNCIFKNITNPIVINLDNSGYGEDSLILNNTFYGITGIAVRVYRYSYGNVIVANNIIHGNGNGTGIFISLVHYGTADQDYNCIHAVATEYAGSAISAPHNIDSTNSPGNTNPQFVVDGTNFHLQATSPCINAGAGTTEFPVIPTVDFDNTVRPQDGSWDIGALEYLNVPTAPAITDQPDNTHKNLGNTVTFSVAASGTTPFTYNWRKNGVSLVNGYVTGVGTVSGQNTASLVISGIEADAEDGYDVVVSNGISPDATSNEARLFLSWLVGDVVGADYPTLKAIADSGVLMNGNIINLSGTVDDSQSGNITNLGYIDVTIRKRPTDLVKPQVLLGSEGRLSCDYSSNNYENIIFRGNERGADMMLKGWGGTFHVSGCEFYDDNYTIAAPWSRAIATLDAEWYISNCIFKNFAGSAIYVGSGLRLLDSCTFENIGLIHADHYAVHDVSGYSNQTCTIKNCTFKNIGGGVINTPAFDSGVRNILNNTIFSFGSAHANSTALFFDSDNNDLVLHMYNNIIHGNNNTTTTALNITALVTVEQDYNCIHGCTIEYAGIAASAAHNIDSTNNPGATNPLFTNAAGGDFTLLDDSPCIDTGAGTSVYAEIPVVDIAGNVRPLAPLAGWDMGAYERALSEATPPQIDVQPLSQQVSAHTNVTFTVVASGGVEPLSYQWKKSGANIAGATNSTLVLQQVTDEDQDIYTVVVTDSNWISVESYEATLRVDVAPRIISQPTIVFSNVKHKDNDKKGVNVKQATATISVVVSADVDVPLTSVWTKKGVVVGTSQTLVIERISQDDLGFYIGRFTNEFGTAVTNPIELRAYNPLEMIKDIVKQCIHADNAKKIHLILDIIRILKSRGHYR